MCIRVEIKKAAGELKVHRDCRYSQTRDEQAALAYYCRCAEMSTRR